MTFSMDLSPEELLMEKLKNSSDKKVIILAGPTATGKTDLSIDLAKQLNGEIVSADSMQVYKGLDVGTAKVTIEQMQGVPHHLIDIREVNEPYNVAAYAKDATAAITHILSKGKTPIVVGGNGFYLHALIYGPPLGPSSLPEVRKKIEEDLEKFGVELLFEKLTLLDPQYAATITLQDRHKIVRALEIITITNKKVTDFPKPNYNEENLPFQFLCYFMYYPKPQIYQRIEKRCDEMMQQGLVEETKKMIIKGLENNSSAANAIGYRQVLQYLKSEQSSGDYHRLIDEFKKASRHYAKRQFTWFKREPLFQWKDLSMMTKTQLIQEILADYRS